MMFFKIISFRSESFFICNDQSMKSSNSNLTEQSLYSGSLNDEVLTIYLQLSEFSGFFF